MLSHQQVQSVVSLVVGGLVDECILDPLVILLVEVFALTRKVLQGLFIVNEERGVKVNNQSFIGRAGSRDRLLLPRHTYLGFLSFGFELVLALDRYAHLEYQLNIS